MSVLLKIEIATPPKNACCSKAYMVYWINHTFV